VTGQYQTRSYIDALGKRLASGKQTERDLEELESFRSSFTSASQAIQEMITSLGYVSTGRRKTPPAIIKKLQRPNPPRLSTMQDIAGLRIVVDDIPAQDAAVAALRGLVACELQDRRAEPKHGYRAVHLIYNVGGSAVELQVRTVWQQRFAEVVEKLAEVDPEIKYGGGLERHKNMVAAFSRSVVLLEGPGFKSETSGNALRASLELLSGVADWIAKRGKP
jgi:ppGpp synthetase/RelA/SpoT-type nucleotidyltranferase